MPRSSPCRPCLRSLRLVFLVAALRHPSAVGAQSCPANIPHVTGVWTSLPYQMPINPISATLLHTGKVLLVSGSENDAAASPPGADAYFAAIWDPTGTTAASVAIKDLTYDVFCSGTAVLPDGRALVVGGTDLYGPPYPTFTGDNRASIYDPVADRFIQSQSMVTGRWYATTTVLPDGRIMAFSGSDPNGNPNTTVEIYSLTDAGAGWTDPVTAPFTPPLYPRMMLLPNGTVFFTGQGNLPPTANSWTFDPLAERWTVSAATTSDRTYGTALLLPLLPPWYAARVMNLGGGLDPATRSTELIDLSAASPFWTPGPAMSAPRVHLGATVLPNGKVLVQGGSQVAEVPDDPGKTADLYDPATNTMRSAGTAAYSRLYHSTALLLPDARVATLGS